MIIKNNVLDLSWRKVRLFLECKRCFYKEIVLQKKYPQLNPDCFSINNSVDQLWKSEFDQYRADQKPHPLMIKHNIDAIPYSNELLPIWRNYMMGGIHYIDHDKGFKLLGIIDDVWINAERELIIVDYKTTARRNLNYNNKWNSYDIRQLCFYANLFKQNGYKVQNTGYLIYSIARQDKESFNQTLEFETIFKPCFVNSDWLENVLQDIRNLVDSPVIPQATYNCSYCRFDLNESTKTDYEPYLSIATQ